MGFSELARAHPHKAALVVGGAVRTFGELDRRSDALAAWMGARFDAGRRVAVMAPNGTELVEAWLAAAKVDLAVVPVNWHLKRDEVAYVLADSGAGLLVSHVSLAAEAEAAAAAAGGVEVLLAGGPGGSYERAVADGAAGNGVGPAAGGGATPEAGRVGRGRGAGRVPHPVAGLALPVFYTSGTTGRPKGVVRLPPPPGAAEPPAQTDLWGWTADDVHVLAGPAYHAGPAGHLMSAVAVGATTVVLERFDARAWLAAVDRHRGTTSFMVPAHFVRILEVPEEERRRYDLSSLRLIAHAGAPCPVEVKARILDVLAPAAVWERYGTTEGMVTAISPEEWRQRPGSVGRPWPGIEVRVLDADGRRLPPGEQGLVYVHHAWGNRFEYRGDPGKTAAAWRDGAYTVGDVGYLDEDGYLFLTDRASDMVIRGGVNVYPREVELVLGAHPAVVDCAVFGVPDDRLGERLKAMVELRAPATEEELAGWCRARLADFKVPAEVEVVAELPRDPNGKLRKRELRERHWAGRDRRIG